MAGEDTSLDRSICRLLTLVPYESPSTHEYVIAISSAARGWDAVLVWIDSKTGFLLFEDKAGKDVFPDMDSAMKYLQTQGRINVKVQGKVILGCALVACNLWILLCTDVNSRPAVQLPGNHCIFCVTGAQWAYIPLQIRTADPEADFRQGEMLTEFPISGYHYFCETVDITRPFPSSHPVAAPSWEFVWNYYLTQPFRRVGLAAVAPHMLQGLAEQRTLPDLLGKLFSVVLLARRSRLHAGTRYKARGINLIAAAANEIECEQIVALQGVRWASYVWRRGSVPLRWSQTVKPNGVGTAIAIEGERTFSGSRRYFRRLQMRFQNHFMHAAERHPSGHLTPAQRTSSREFPVAVVNLLRKGSIDRDRSEARLYSAFCDLMTALSRGCDMNIINIGLDWHELSATHGGLAPVVQILWGATENNMKSFGFSEGVFEEAKAPDPAKDEAPWGKNRLSRRTRRQQGVFRFNCADSLDRTNVASYYSAFQVLLEQCRTLGLQVVAHRSDAVVTSAPGSAARDAVSRTVARKQSVQNATKMLGTFAARMGSMAQGLVAQPPSAPPPGGTVAATAETSEEPAPPPPAPPPPTHILAADGTWWERKQVPWPASDPNGKRDVYVNHDSRTTQWDAPPAWSSWELSRQPVDRIRALAHTQLLVVYKDLFRVSGDKNAELYTGSAAMHSSQLDLLLSEASSGHGVSGFFNNAHTAVTRRFKNILTDDRTHSIFELILGNDPAASVDCGPSFASRNAAAALAEEAQALPACDDADSDGDADPISLIPWPARPAGGSGSAADASQPPSPGSASAAAPTGGAAGPAASASAMSGGSPPASPPLKPPRDNADLEELTGPASASRGGLAVASSASCGDLNAPPGATAPAQQAAGTAAQLASDFQGLATGAGAIFSSQAAAAAAAPPAPRAAAPATDAAPRDLLALDADVPEAEGGHQAQLLAPQQMQMPSSPGCAAAAVGPDAPCGINNSGAAAAANAAPALDPLAVGGPASHSVPVATALDEDDPFSLGVAAGAAMAAVGGAAGAPQARGSQGESLGRLSSSYVDVKIPDGGLVDPLGCVSDEQGSLL